MRVDLWKDGAWINGVEIESVAAAEILFPGHQYTTDAPGADGWTLVDGVPTAPTPSVPTVGEVGIARKAAYAAESDHLFMAWQASVATNGADQEARRLAWLAARDAIQERYPYPG
jgi:hypothetical protein